MKNLLTFLLFTYFLAAWLAHIIVYLLLISVAIFLSVCAIHGFGLWLGVNW